MKGRSKSVSFGIVLKHPEAKRNSIISETSSVDVTDGAKMSIKRKSIIKLPYKTSDSQVAESSQGHDTADKKQPLKVFRQLLLGITLHVVFTFFVGRLCALSYMHYVLPHTKVALAPHL